MRNRNELFVVIATVVILACMVFSVLGVGTGCSDRTTASKDDDDDIETHARGKAKQSTGKDIIDDDDIEALARGGSSSTARMAKEKAKQVSCTNNLKMIGLAAKQYAVCYDDWLPCSTRAYKPVWMNGRSGDSLELLRIGDFLADPKIYTCPSKEEVTAAKSGRPINDHVAYNWCDGLMDGNFGMSPIACDGLDNHSTSGRFLRGDGSVSVANDSGDRKWTRDRLFMDACYNKKPPEYSF